MVENNLTRALEELAREQGVEVPTPDENGAIAMTVAGVQLALTCHSGESDDIFCHAVVGTVAELEHPDRVLSDALAANFFWEDTAGGTLSLLPGTDNLMLADRRDDDFFDSVETLKDYLATFATKVNDWRVYLNDCRVKTKAEVK